MHKEFIQLLKKRDLGDLFNDTFGFIRSEFKPLMIGVTLVAAIPFLALGIPQVMAFGDLESLIEQFRGGGIPDSFMLLFPISFLRVYFSAVLVAYLYSYLKAYKESGGEYTVDNRQIISAAFRKSFKAFGLLFLYSLICMVGFMFFVIPGIYLAVLLGLCLPAALAEDYSISDSLRRSSDLVKNNWWWTFLVVIIFYIIVSILGSIIQIPLMGFSFIEGITMAAEGAGGTPDFTWLWVASVIAEFFSAFFLIVLYIGTGIYYYSRVEEVDGSGLLQEIDNMGTVKDAVSTLEEDY